MPVEAIGSTLGASSADDLSTTTLNQDDFLRLFLTELNFQDPLEPIDNREFLAQIAQFTALEQARQTTESVEKLVTLDSANQAVELIGKSITIGSGTGLAEGVVTAVRFSEDGSLLTVDFGNNNVQPDIRLSDISLVRTVETNSN